MVEWENEKERGEKSPGPRVLSKKSKVEQPMLDDHFPLTTGKGTFLAHHSESGASCESVEEKWRNPFASIPCYHR